MILATNYCKLLSNVDWCQDIDVKGAVCLSLESGKGEEDQASSFPWLASPVTQVQSLRK